MATHPSWDDADAQAIVRPRAKEPGAMLPLLHALQDRFGYIDDRAIPVIAAALNISKAETVGVISFYHDFKRRPPAETVLKICRAESCQAAGCEDLVAHLAQHHGLDANGHRSGSFAVETVYCLGACAASPAAMLDGEVIAMLTKDALDELVASVRAAR